MSLFKRLVSSADDTPHKHQIALISPISGKVLTLDEAPDPLHTARIFGEGVLLQPSGYQVISPVEGKVVDCTRNGHLLTLKSKQGLSLRLQLGMFGEALPAIGVQSRVNAGDAVTLGQVLLDFDVNKLKFHLKSPLCAFTVLNSDRMRGIVAHQHTVVAGEDPAMTLLL